MHYENILQAFKQGFYTGGDIAGTVWGYMAKDERPLGYKADKAFSSKKASMLESMAKGAGDCVGLVGNIATFGLLNTMFLGEAYCTEKRQFMDRKKYFLEIFKKAERKYGEYEKRLAAEGWEHGWQVLIATIMSAQSRDEATIPIAENLFNKYKNLEELSKADYKDVLEVFKSLNYNKTKSKNVIAAARFLVEKHSGKIPDNIEELIEIPGVGRKTANLAITECHKKEGICVDTHVHRLLNVLDIVNTKTPHQTEFEMMKVAPREYWSRINRIFVLWGKECPGRDKIKILKKLEE